jgi:hypothetical protein
VYIDTKYELLVLGRLMEPNLPGDEYVRRMAFFEEWRAARAKLLQNFTKKWQKRLDKEAKETGYFPPCIW